VIAPLDSFPDADTPGSIEAKAGTTIYAPAQNADIVLDDQVGPEVLYVIASRRRLDLADPELAEAMAKVRPGAADIDCGAPLEQVLAKQGPAKSELGHAPGAVAGRAARVRYNFTHVDSLASP